MFEFRRELRRLFGRPRGGADASARDEPARLELSDLKTLRAEARAAEAAASRAGARDRGRPRLTASALWRELARRSGEAQSLRRATAAAEAAADAFAGERRRQDFASARLALAGCALVGLELFGDGWAEPGAEAAAAEAERVGGPTGMMALACRTRLRVRRAVSTGVSIDARKAARAFNDPIALLEMAGRRDPHLRLAAAEARLARAQLLRGAGLRLRDPDLLAAAVGDLGAAEQLLDPALEPLAWARVSIAKASAKAALGEITGDASGLARSVSALAAAIETVRRNQSPLDWARGQMALAQALAGLGEATQNQAGFRRALACYDRAALVLKEAPGLVARAEAASGRGLALARIAELTGDVRVLDAAEAAFKAELVAEPHRGDPVAWAMLQVQLGQVYATRLGLTGRDRGERAAAALAFQAALEVFGEHGLGSLTRVASEALERLAAAKARSGGAA